jgi:hypothetical protein
MLQLPKVSVCRRWERKLCTYKVNDVVGEVMVSTVKMWRCEDRREEEEMRATARAKC